MSDLLNAASLIMIPSGYSEDKVYSAVPTDGSGDLSFTRASNGTRVNSSGLVEDCPWNLLFPSELFQSTDWAPSNATITANDTTAPNGTLTADKLTSTSTITEVGIRNATFTITANVGQSYTGTVYAKKGTANFLRIRNLFVNNGGSNGNAWFNLNTGTVGTVQSSQTASMEDAGNGWYRCILTGVVGSTNNYNLFDVGFTNTDATLFPSTSINGYIWGAQLNIGSTAKPYFPTTDRLNVPRLTYQNGGGGCPSLLLEKQSTNLLTYSQDFTQASWNKTNQGGGSVAVVTANYAISPDGTQNATRFVCNLNGGTSSSDRSWMLGNFSAPATSTISIWIKLNSAGTKTFVFSDSGGGTKTINGTDWQRIDGTFVSAGGEFRIGLIGGSSSDTLDCSIWGAQAEASSYPTSYIPTTSASATRVADACFKTGISSLFGTNQGTFFIDFVYNNSGQFDYLFDITDSSNVNRFLMYDTSGSGLYLVYDTANSSITTVQLTKGQRYKIAVKYNSSGTIWYLNGVLSATGTVSFAYQMSQIYLNQRFNLIAQSQIQVSQTIVFSTALINADIIALTTI